MSRCAGSALSLVTQGFFYSMAGENAAAVAHLQTACNFTVGGRAFFLEFLVLRSDEFKGLMSLVFYVFFKGFEG